MQRRAGGRPLDILFVGDDPGVVKRTRATLRDIGLANDLTVAPTGPEALELLDGPEEPADAAPDVVLLDGDAVDARAIRRELRAAVEAETVSVVTLLADPGGEPAASTDVVLGKPVDGIDLVERLLEADEVWVRVVSGPTRRGTDAPGDGTPPSGPG